MAMCSMLTYRTSGSWCPSSGRCANNLNQAAIHVNTYGGIYPDEIKALQRDYADLWRPLADLLKKLAAVVEM